jgi:segregation and condensation protein B
MLRQLLDRDLVAVGGRSEEIGRPNLYVTTRYFLRVFGLGRIEDLPPISAVADPQQPS